MEFITRNVTIVETTNEASYFLKTTLLINALLLDLINAPKGALFHLIFKALQCFAQTILTLQATQAGK